MVDVFALIFIAMQVGLAFAYTHGCERLKGKPS